MDSQEFRNLQEAYMEVVENQQQFDEVLTGDRRKRALNIMRGKNFKGKTAEQAGRIVSGIEGSINKDGERINLPKKRGGSGERGEEKTGRGGDWNADRGRRAINASYEYDLYDIILSHLLDEGYAETPEAAEAIMVNMSEDWREDIVEKSDDTYLEPNRKKRKKNNEKAIKDMKKDPNHQKYLETVRKQFG